MKAPKRKFQSEVHLGLMAVIFLLLFLNFTSNFLIFNLRSGQRDVVAGRMLRAARQTEIVIAGNSTMQLTGSHKAELLRQFGLYDIWVAKTEDPLSAIEDRRAWFAAEAMSLPPDRVPELAAKVLDREIDELSRLKGSQYVFLHEFSGTGGTGLLVLTSVEPELAHLDDIYRLAITMTIVALLITGVVYLLLSRLIFLPFRKIRREAEEAGRFEEEPDDEVEAVVDEYRRIIDELREKERQLLKVNEQITHRADSLEQFNRDLLESMIMGVVTVDSNGVIKSINPAAARLLGLTEPEMVGRSYRQVFEPISPIAAALRHVLRFRNPGPYTEVTLTSDKTRTLGLATSVVIDASGADIGASLLINDLTEINELRAQVETGQRLSALGEMAGGLAHQLRNSMGAISGYLTLLKKRMAKRGVEDDSLVELAHETEEAAVLVHRFLEFARPLKLNPEPIGLNPFLGEIVESFRVREDLKHVNFELTEACECSLTADSLLLKQALTNLMENAANAYNGNAGTVQLSASRQDESITIAVSDQGCGIQPDAAEKIFTPFYSSRPSGNGLGLPLVRKIVDLHNGQLLVNSRPGRGSTFTILLPVKIQFSIHAGV